MKVFKCRFCGMMLFNSSDVEGHQTNSNVLPNYNPFKTFTSKIHNHKELKNQRFIEPENSQCDCYFIKQQDWITEYEGNTGRIICPRKTCAVRLGSYSWTGLKCSCGEFKSPAFKIIKESISEIPQFL